HAEPSRAGPPIYIVRQLLLQRRPERGWTHVVQSSIRNRLHGTLVRRLDAQLRRRRVGPTRLCTHRIPVAKCPQTQKNAAELRRIRQEYLSQEIDMDRLLHRFHERSVQAERDSHGESQREAAGAAYAHRLPLVSAAHARCVSGSSIYRGAEAI